jgi:Zn-dependent peptidase ImmA (M78 family)/transcriptional regulator with XRE-family HTH domain
VPGLETVRLARGMSQSELAMSAALSQAAVSKAEAGGLLARDRLERLSHALTCTPELLLNSDVQLSATACVFHRKRASTTVGQAKQARALLALTRVHAEALMDVVGAPPARLPRLAPTADDYLTPEDVAREVRQVSGLVGGPIPNLVEALESVGVVVVARELGGRRLDALSDWLPGHRPVFMLNASAPADRQRFTLAHEAGHAVMHELLTDVAEAQADRFAAELLMPAAEIRDELDGLTLERLLVLKRRWRVSAAALARRASDLGSITDYRYRSLNMEMSAAGWRRVEPVLLETEIPMALASALGRARADIGSAATARRVCLLESQLEVMLNPGETSD